MTPDRIRNVVLVGHSGSGKTALAEALLHAAGVTTRLGRIEDGNTVTDFEPEEISRGSSVSLAMAPFDWAGHKVNIIDAPGYSDFVGEARAALRAADLALFVVSGVDGVEVQTTALWRMAGEEGIARAFFVSKLDRERASFSRTLTQLKAAFGTAIAPLQVPIGVEHQLSGVANLIGGTAFTYDGSPKGRQTDIPSEVRQEVAALRTALIEAVVETDDSLLERYLEGTEPTDEELVAAMRRGMLEGTAFPVLCGASVRMVGVDRLAQFLVDYGPSPAERPSPPLSQGEALPDSGVVAYVFKTQSDPYVGRIALFRVFRGSIPVDTTLENPTRGGTGRMHNLFTMRGKEHQDLTEVAAGDIAAVAKLESVLAGDTLRSPGVKVAIEPVRLPRPAMTLAVFPRSQQDEEKLSLALQRAAEDDPTLHMERRADTNETVLAGLGDTHLEVAVSRLSARFGVEVDTALPRIPYRETIRGTADVEGKHKKQTGGRGQFGVAYVRFAPAPGRERLPVRRRGQGRQHPPSVHPGGGQGHPGRAGPGHPRRLPGGGHPGHRLRRQAPLGGLRRALLSDGRHPRRQGRRPQPQADPPRADHEGHHPGARGRDGRGHRRPQLAPGPGAGHGLRSGLRVITAEVPLAEMQRYSIDLRSITSGRGSFEMVMDHYEEAPPQETQKVVAAAKEEKE